MSIIYSRCCDIQSRAIVWADPSGQAMDSVAWSSFYANKFADEGKTLSLANPLSVSVES